VFSIQVNNSVIGAPMTSNCQASFVLVSFAGNDSDQRSLPASYFALA
jgi:hypothetical protein